MNSKKFKQVLDYTDRSEKKIHTQVQQQKQATEIIRASLPAHLAPHLHSCILTERRLILYTDSANWASQLRFYHPMVSRIVQEKLQYRVNAIQVKVFFLPEIKASDVKSKELPLLKKQTMDMLYENALSIDDNKLKNALLKLQKTLCKRAC